MLVRNWMTSPARTVSSTTTVAEAYNLMTQFGVRRLPVVEHGRLVGIVTIGDLREARPSPATSLSIYELNYLLARLTVREVMTHDPFTITPDRPVKEAAQLMLTQKVSGLPVVDRNGAVVGIITESDIFRMLIDTWDALDQTSLMVGAMAVGA